MKWHYNITNIKKGRKRNIYLYLRKRCPSFFSLNYTHSCSFAVYTAIIKDEGFINVRVDTFCQLRTFKMI